MTNVPQVYAAIAAVAADLARLGIPKTQVNKSEQYSFRGIDQVFNRLSPALAAHRLCILPRMLERTVAERNGGEGTILIAVAVKVAFDFVCAEDGSSHTVEAFGEALDPGDKATAKAVTAAYKYAVLQAFCIPLSGTDDADSQSYQLRVANLSAEPVQGWEQWSRDIADMIRGCETGEAVDRVQNRYRGLLNSISRERPDLYSSVGKAIQLRRRELAPRKKPRSAKKKRMNGAAAGTGESRTSGAHG